MIMAHLLSIHGLLFQSSPLSLPPWINESPRWTPYGEFRPKSNSSPQTCEGKAGYSIELTSGMTDLVQ